MKKLFVALMCMAAIAFTSCSSDPLVSGTKASNLTAEKVEKMDDKTDCCWHVAAKGTVKGEKKTGEFYGWGTEKEVAAECLLIYEAWKANKSASGVEDFEIAYKKASAKDEAACAKLDAEVEKNNQLF